MEELCSMSTEGLSDLERKIDSFIDDRTTEAVTGIRRMGRDNLVDLLVEKCRGKGLSCSIYPDTSGTTVVFRDWLEVDGPAKELLESDKDRDILFGQDLCHQVPAVVRWNTRRERV